MCEILIHKFRELKFTNGLKENFSTLSFSVVRNFRRKCSIHNNSGTVRNPGGRAVDYNTPLPSAALGVIRQILLAC